MNTSQQNGTDAPINRIASACKYANTLILIILGLYFFIVPGVITAYYLSDPALKGPGIPKIVWRTHKSITPRYETWARERIASGVAAHLMIGDVPSTEWPIFGSVFYLWTTEALQKEWEKNPELSSAAPKAYAKATIDAARDVVLDKVHHTWVQQHWGTNYLHTQNVFFRSLLMAGILSHHNLTGDQSNLALLKDQADTLSAILDESPFGILEDYPGECYPIDVLASIAIISKTDKALGTDHSSFLKKSVRAFDGNRLDELGLVPFLADSVTGEIYTGSRGTGNSYISIFAPELYPQKAGKWYELYEKHFWQESMGAAGFREFPRGTPDKEWGFDIDAGPIIAGFSPAANAYGVAAARVNGRFDHAYTLGSQVIMATWPLPDGTLLGPRLLSSGFHAPYLGEANLMYLLVQQPAEGVEIRTGGRLPWFVWGCFAFYFGVGLLIALAAIRELRRWNRTVEHIPFAAFQVAAWSIVFVAAVILAVLGNWLVAMLCLVVSQIFPHALGRKPEPSP
ncbi:MAG: hypothetical protein C0404_04725 [Verrucomicrobia bacterium]|nr:hypothetical protein [Verrucomicrobiota bacterium]